MKPRHCTHQALLQQPDQLILSNTLPRPAARALFSLRLHSVSLPFRLCAPTPVVGDGMMMRELDKGSVMSDFFASYIGHICSSL